MLAAESLVIPGTIVISTAAVLVCFAQYYRYLNSSVTDRSTTSSAGGGPAAYETSKAVDEYVQMHFALPEEVFPYKNAPKEDVSFVERCAVLVEQHCDALKDFTGERPPPVAIDIGCAVGGAVFQLSKCGFSEVLGIDFSHAFIAAANAIKRDGMITYKAIVEGNITEGMVQEMREAHIPSDSNPEDCRFMVGDACNLSSKLKPVDAVLSANLLCRLPNPRKFLNHLPKIVKPGGVVVLTTPFSWLEGWTKKENWLGGHASSLETERAFVDATHTSN